MGPRIREDKREKMGSRIREDKGRGSREGNEILHSASLRSE